MTALRELIGTGGAPIIAIMALSIVLYSRCFRVLFALYWTRWQLRGKSRVGTGGSVRPMPNGLAGQLEFATPAAARLARLDLQEEFDHQRTSLRAMIAAAPLLGLLGTVSGMAKTFEHLGGPAGEKSMENLAQGISEVLVATEAGLAVAIPAMVLVFLAHREVRRHAELLNLIERRLAGRP